MEELFAFVFILFVVCVLFKFDTMRTRSIEKKYASVELSGEYPSEIDWTTIHLHDSLSEVMSAVTINSICMQILEEELFKKQIDQEEENWDDHFQNWDNSI